MILLFGDTLATLDTYSVTFPGGAFSQTYVVTVDIAHPLTNVVIQYSIGGTDGPSYILPSTTLTIPIFGQETIIPTILSGSVLSTDRSSAQIQNQGNTLASVYYMIADKNVPAPTYNDVRSRAINDTLKYSNPIYGVAYIKTITRILDVTIPNLSPGRDYDFYAYIVNLNNVTDYISFPLTFSTKKSQKIAEFVMAIKQNSLSQELQSEIFSKIAAMLSIPKTRLKPKTTDCAQTQDSLFYNTPNTTYLHIYVLPDPISENNLNTPLTLVENLNQRRTEIQAFVPRLADGDLLQIQELPDDIPAFKSRPSFVQATTDTLFFSASFTRCGQAYAIAVPVVGSRNQTESGLTIYASEQPTIQYASCYQIQQQLNLTNQPIYSTTARINDFSQTYTMNISGLNDKLIYEIYICAENDWPTYNLLMQDTNVARLEIKTLKRRKPLNIFSSNFKWQSKLYAGVIGLIALVVMLI